MPERWRTELRKINHLHPDEDLVDRALARPRRKAPVRRLTTRIATVAFALILPAALIVGAIRIAGGRGSQAPAAERSSVAVPPTNGELLYTKRLSDGWSLFAIDPSTGVERQITHGYRDYGSDWSPDGTKIVYDSESQSGSGDQGIWVVSADGSNATKLIDDGSVPAWSPDGTEIAFARPDIGTMVPTGDGSEGTAFSIYVVDADGKNIRRLTSPGHVDYAPAWSPDGSRIAFVRIGVGLFVMSSDGSDARQLTGPDLDIFSEVPDWSPDGATIAVAVNGIERGTPGGIMLVPADGSGGPSMVPGTEATQPGYVTNPAWSPDGQWLAYTHGGAGGIVIVHPDGSDPRTLAVDPATDTIEELAWGPAALAGSPAP